MNAEWVFDPASPSGSRKGGNAAEYGFEGQIDTLVREIVQNSMDAGKPAQRRVGVVFRLIELTGSNRAEFLKAMSWQSLQDNLNSVTRNGEAIQRALAEMEETDRLLLLCVEDRGTDGLTGTEKRQDDSETNRFSALVRDELYSDKDSDDAGGSYGLGKILLWAYSSFKTVLFATSPCVCPDGYVGPRFIGRTSLPWHETADDGPCAGSGWLGTKRRDDDAGEWSRWAESLWGDVASETAQRCHAARAQDDFGLSTVIVGFEEPGQETRSIDELIKSLEQAALESFWPAIVRNSVSIAVRHEHNGEEVCDLTIDPEAHPEYEALAGLLREFDAGNLDSLERLHSPGDATWRDVPIEVPERISEGDPHEAQTSQVKLLVQLLEDDDSMESVRDRVYRFRRPGMVVRSTSSSGLSISARPYIAALVCGRAVDDTEMDGVVEKFLRAAEPPEHDRWAPDTRAIKASYKTHGIKAKLDRFENAIRSAIRELVSIPEKKGGTLPKELLKHLRFGDAAGGGHKQFLSATSKGYVDGRTWHFSTRVRRTRLDPDNTEPWSVRVRLKYAVDGGNSDDIHAIGTVTCEKATIAEVRNGVAFLEIPPNIGQVTIHGQTDPDKLPAIGTRSAMEIRVDGQAGGLDA